MKIDFNIQNNIKIFSYENNFISAPRNNTFFLDNKYYKDQLYYPSVYFLGKINPKKIKDLPVSKKRLLKQLDEILKENLPQNFSEEEIRLKYLKHISSVAKKMENYYFECLMLKDAKFSNKINAKEAYDNANRLLKEIKQLKNSGDKLYIDIRQPKDDATDYRLIEKFKTAIYNDKFNFTDIFKEHYQSLENITTIKELKKEFPNIQVPKRPEYIIADKLQSSLTRDFYQDLHKHIKTENKDEFANSMTKKIAELLNNNFKTKTEEETNFYVNKISKPLIKAITLRLKKAVIDKSFSSIPEIKKTRKNLITEDDIRLLKIDYDDFVTSIIREQYLKLKNPNEIVYTKGNTKLKVSSIRDSVYKFDKIPSRIKGILADAENIKNTQRNYESYTPELFRERLEFYSDIFSDNEQVLEHIINFHSSKFELEDISMLIKFLRSADLVFDSKITITEFLNYIYKNSIRPAGTEKLNKLEQQKAIEMIKAEHKKLAVLKNKQQQFDNYIFLLYKNEMSFIAELCSKYKPENLNSDDIKYTEIIMKTISDNIDKDGNIINKEKLRLELFRKVTYFERLNSNSQILKSAQYFAKNKNGDIDIEKAGKYIINHDIVEQYPDSIQYSQNKEIIKTIIEYFKTDKEKAIQYLCKFDNYTELPTNQKNKIINILNIFNLKEDIDKIVIKQILENNYTKLDTTAKAQMTEKGRKTILATISANAKMQIMDYYKFPKCIEYFKAFENALSQFATLKGSSGIKLLSNNNTLKNVAELKIKGYPDRLISNNGAFYFDYFSNTGLH